MSEANHDAASRPMNRIVTRDDLGGNEIEIAALPELGNFFRRLARMFFYKGTLNPLDARLLSELARKTKESDAEIRKAKVTIGRSDASRRLG